MSTDVANDDWPLISAEKVAAEIMGDDFPPKTVLQMAREGRIPSQKIGRHVRFSRSAVQEAVRRAAERGNPL